MADWDAATASAVAAVVVALIALLVAVAQATQQYLITGQLIRLCDSVVFGPMPGQGRRVWHFSQFRFRVIYSIPQISLESHLWPSGGAHMKSHAVGQHELPPLADSDNSNRARLDRISTAIAYHSGKLRKILDWFPRKRQQQCDSSSIDSPPRSSASIVPVKKWFKLLIPHPSALRQRRPGSNLSLTLRNEIPIHQPRESVGTTTILSDSSDSGSNDSVQSVSHHRTSHVGEASWVSFCRAIEIPCRRSVRIDLVEYDADRCPSDLISVPMQVSMRDIIIMALMAGMELTNASFHDKSISMQGAVGTLTSSNHAILGPILHFTPRNVQTSLPMLLGERIRDVDGKINTLWIWRTWDTCSVAGSPYNSNRRRTVRRLDERWIRDKKGVESIEVEEYLGPETSPERKQRTRGTKHKPKSKADLSVGDKPVDRNRSVLVSARPRNRYQVPGRRGQDGLWFIRFPVPPPQPIITMTKYSSGSQIPRMPTYLSKTRGPTGRANYPEGPAPEDFPTMSQSGDKNDSKDPVPPFKPHNIEDYKLILNPLPLGPNESYPPLPLPTPRRVTVEDAIDEDPTANPTGSSNRGGVEVFPLLERIEDDQDGEKHESSSTLLSDRARLARERQDARAEKLNQIEKDKIVVDNVVKRRAMISPYKEAKAMLGPPREEKQGPFLLTNYPHFPDKELPAGLEPTAEEEAAHEREVAREKGRHERDEAREDRNRARHRAVDLVKVDMFWLCQTDVVSGGWATPWYGSIPIPSALDGAVTVILEALLGFLDEDSSLCYTGSHDAAHDSYKRTADWMLEGNSTCPAHGQNARGGVISSGTYRGVHVPCFESMIPALDLLHSYSWQVDSDLHGESESTEEQNVELMRLDSWLSYVGRVPEIAEGPHNLLQQTPALVHLLMEDFEIDFQNIDLSASEGGLQDIQGLAGNVMDFLTDEELTQPEQLYVLVALLRGVKAAQCVSTGSDTREVMDILLKDVQAHLV